MLPETKFLVQYLRTLKVGDIADYATLSEKAGVFVLDRRHILTSALNYVAREYQMVFQNMPSIGYKLLPSSSAPEVITQKRTNQVRSRVKSWRRDIHNSGTASTMKGLQSLAQCAYVDAAVDGEVQKRIASRRHQQAIDSTIVKKDLLSLFD